MRNLLIVILGAVCIWLLIERSQLSEKLSVAETEVGQLQKKLEAVQRPVVTSGGHPVYTPGTSISAPGQSGPKGSWLDEHVERGARALNPADKNKR